jgi:hypothetical protein
MAISFLTDHPQALLKSFDAKISQKEQKGKITTWEKSNDGKYYTHKAEEWNKKAWFKPVIKDGELTFNIIKPGDQKVTVIVYGYYHGHLTETFLNHFDGDFTWTSSTAKATADDNCG